MNRLNQALLTVTLIIVLIAGAWFVAKETVIQIIVFERRALLAEQQVQQLQAQLAGRPASPPVTGRPAGPPVTP